MRTSSRSCWSSSSSAEDAGTELCRLSRGEHGSCVRLLSTRSAPSSSCCSSSRFRADSVRGREPSSLLLPSLPASRDARTSGSTPSPQAPGRGARFALRLRRRGLRRAGLFIACGAVPASLSPKHDDSEDVGDEDRPRWALPRRRQIREAAGLCSIGRRSRSWIRSSISSRRERISSLSGETPWLCSVPSDDSPGGDGIDADVDCEKAGG
mmetsp:Transcript_14688/g.43494  ORF Transcript_14688/g.43494 Transcript_14688/m.43494 type:complete len:210 (+) Transcript_14688:2495-3124(+)